MKAPCKDCKDRKVGCHAECEAYQKFVKENKEIKEKLLNDRMKDEALWGLKRKRWRK